MKLPFALLLAISGGPRAGTRTAAPISQQDRDLRRGGEVEPRHLYGGPGLGGAELVAGRQVAAREFGREALSPFAGRR